MICLSQLFNLNSLLCRAKYTDKTQSHQNIKTGHLNSTLCDTNTTETTLKRLLVKKANGNVLSGQQLNL